MKKGYSKAYHCEISGIKEDLKSSQSEKTGSTHRVGDPNATRLLNSMKALGW